MAISMRSMLTAGVSLLTASAVAVAPVEATPTPRTTHTAAVELSAAQSPLTPRVSTEQAGLFAAALTPRADTGDGDAVVGSAAAAGVLSAGSNLMDLYYAALPWVQWGFQTATWAVGWVPVVGLLSGQIMVAFYTGEPVVQSWFQSVAYALDGNFAAIPATLVNGVVDGANAFIQNEINWFLGFFPPFPPFPPFPSTVAVNAATAQPQAFLGNPIVTASDLASGVAAGLVGSWYPAAGLIDAGVGLASGVLDTFRWVPGVPVANFQLNQFWNLVQAQGDAAVGFAGDLITIANTLVAASVANGIGPALNDAVSAALQSVQLRGDAAASALTGFSVNQLRYFTGIDLPKGPTDTLTFGVPQVFRDVLGPLAPIVGPSNALSTTQDSSEQPVENAPAVSISQQPAAESGQVAAGDVGDTGDNTGKRERPVKAGGTAKLGGAEQHSTGSDVQDDDAQDDDAQDTENQGDVTVDDSSEDGSFKDRVKNKDTTVGGKKDRAERPGTSGKSDRTAAADKRDRTGKGDSSSRDSGGGSDD